MNLPNKPLAIAGSLRRIYGVATLALRASLRTRSGAILLLSLLLVVVILPHIIKGDGTLDGTLHILLSYTLNFGFGILCLATLWASCALFAADIDNARAQLDIVKPVTAGEFWLGKWSALLALNAFMLLSIYGAVYLQLRWRMHYDQWPATSHPVSQHVTHPIMPSPQIEAQQIYEHMAANDELPKGYSRQAVLRLLARKAPERYIALGPQEAAHWQFRLHQPLHADQALSIKLRFETEFQARTSIKGECRLYNRELDRALTIPLDDFTLREIKLAVPLDEFGEIPADGLRDFELSFEHLGKRDSASGLLLRPRQDIVLLTPGGSFVTNMLRAAMVHWSILALLGAFGLTLSVSFSLPVATFVGTMVLALTLVSNSVINVISEEEAREWSNRVGVAVSRTVHMTTRPSFEAAPLRALVNGEQITLRQISPTLGWNLALLPFIYLSLSCLIFRRRELAIN